MHYEMPKQKDIIPWNTLFFLVYIAPSIAIPLIIYKCYAEKYNYIENGKHLIYLGAFIILSNIFRCLQVVALDGPFAIARIMASVAYCIVGTFMILKGRQFRLLGKKFERYISIINELQDTSIENIAATYPIPIQIASADLKQMIALGYLSDIGIENEKLKRVSSEFEKNR